ncbi:MAG: solute carrier family 23 protein [Pseudomonadota bacterium]
MRAVTDSLAIGIDDKPAAPLAAFVGLQHLLAVFGGIVTAPLLIALGMGLGAADTAYLISSALLVSGLATAVQIARIGPVGSGLLSIQGTSFTFVGPLIYLYQSRAGELESGAILGALFAACALCSVVVMALSRFVERLRYFVTSRVAAATIVLLGITLVQATLGNIEREYTAAGAEGWRVLVMAGTVFAAIALAVWRGGPMLRLSSILLGLIVGFVVAGALGWPIVIERGDAPTLFLPEFGRYPWSLDLTFVLVLLPIFLISATESVGDLTATASLSKLSITDKPFWQRLRGGLLADAINSFLAALVSTFPNTTFSQNNGVIRLTGVCSRRVGLWAAAFLVLLGLIPVVAVVLNALPGAVVSGATLLMFFMVAMSGFHIARADADRKRSRTVVITAVVSGLALGVVGPKLTALPDALRMLVSFPVSSGAFIAMALEVLLPRK